MSVKRKKKRIYVRVPEEVYDGLAEMQKAGGYRSVCSLAHALLTQLVARYGDGEQRERPPVSDEEQIAEMFRELGDAEAPRYGMAKQRRR